LCLPISILTKSSNIPSIISPSKLDPNLTLSPFTASNLPVCLLTLLPLCLLLVAGLPNSSSSLPPLPLQNPLALSIFSYLPPPFSATSLFLQPILTFSFCRKSGAMSMTRPLNVVVEFIMFLIVKF
jgi:hypothetical protein